MWTGNPDNTHCEQPADKSGTAAGHQTPQDFAGALKGTHGSSHGECCQSFRLRMQAAAVGFAGIECVCEHGLVFSTSIGTAVDRRNLARHFHRTLQTLKIDRRSFHNLRRTALSLLSAQGATLHEVKEIVGRNPVASSVAPLATPGRPNQHLSARALEETGTSTSDQTTSSVTGSRRASGGRGEAAGQAGGDRI